MNNKRKMKKKNKLARTCLEEQVGCGGEHLPFHLYRRQR
jgi:hypothetical protein